VRRRKHPSSERRPEKKSDSRSVRNDVALRKPDVAASGKRLASKTSQKSSIVDVDVAVLSRKISYHCVTGKCKLTDYKINAKKVTL